MNPRNGMAAAKFFAALAGFAIVCGHAQAQENVDSRPAAKAKVFDRNMVDPLVKPCDDFYRYVCNRWMQAHPVPTDRSRWDRFDELEQRNHLILREILEQAAANRSQRSSNEARIGDYYASCLDESATEKKGIAPLSPYLERIAALKSKRGLPSLVASLHRSGVQAFFVFSSIGDMRNSARMIADVGQGGLGLPDRDYYLKQDANSKETRDAYVAHVRRMLQFTGNPGLAAAAKAETILTIETELANGSVDRVALRDPHQRYHKLTLEELSANSPHFDWARYVAARHLATLETLDVEEPEFVKAMDKVVRNHSLEDLKTYLVWQTLSASVNMLPHRFVDEDFEFYGKRLHGAKQLRPRWERCIESTDNDLGNDLGVAYVARTFGEEGKQHTLQMVSKLENALRADIEALPWMGEETKREALVKLTAITNRIGYPDQWRNEEGLEIVLGDALGNSLRAREFDSDYRLGEIGKVPDKNDWPFTVPTVDAQEDPQTNALTFPAGILQPPFFDSFMDTAFNFGASGAVIGHELTHGFDDEGRQFDAKGNLRNWWTKADAAEFTNRAQCLVEEYGDFVAFENTKVDGRLTLGENVADNAGLRIALMALRDSDAESKTPKDGFTPEQRFFLGWGQMWCENVRPEEERLRIVNEHAPERYRVNGVVSNFPEFRQAFGCSADDAMVRQNVCRVW